MEQATSASVPIDSWGANAPEEGWDKPIPSQSCDQLTGIFRYIQPYSAQTVSLTA